MADNPFKLPPRAKWRVVAQYIQRKYGYSGGQNIPSYSMLIFNPEFPHYFPLWARPETVSKS